MFNSFNSQQKYSLTYLSLIVQSLRFEVATNPPSNPEEVQAYLQQSSLLLHVLRCFICTRTTIEKYTEMLSSLTLCLFSISPQEIAAFYQFLLRHWPRGNSEKVSIELISIIKLDNWFDSIHREFTIFLSSFISNTFLKRYCIEGVFEDLSRIVRKSSGDQ